MFTNEYITHSIWFLRRLLLLVAATVLLAGLGACATVQPEFQETVFIPAVSVQVTPGIESF